MLPHRVKRKGLKSPFFYCFSTLDTYTSFNKYAGDLMNMPPTSPKDATKLEDAIEKWTVPIGNLLVSLFHRIALFGIGAATVWSAGVAF